MTKTFKCGCLGCHTVAVAKGFTVFAEIDDYRKQFVSWRRYCEYHKNAYASHTYKTRKEAQAAIVQESLCRNHT